MSPEGELAALCRADVVYFASFGRKKHAVSVGIFNQTHPIQHLSTIPPEEALYGDIELSGHGGEFGFFNPYKTRFSSAALSTLSTGKTQTVGIPWLVIGGGVVVHSTTL